MDLPNAISEKKPLLNDPRSTYTRSFDVVGKAGNNPRATEEKRKE